MRPEEIKSWGRKPWPYESDYEDLSNISKITSWYLSDTRLCIGTTLKRKYYDDDTVVTVAKNLIILSKNFEDNTWFPDLTDYLADKLAWLQSEIETLKEADKGYEMSKYIQKLEYFLKAGKQAVLFDRSRWINDFGNKEAK